MSVPISVVLAALGAIATASTTVLGHVLKQHGEQNREVLARLDAQAVKLATIELTMTRYDVTLFGAQGDNGLSSDVRTLKQHVSDTAGQVRDLRARVAPERRAPHPSGQDL